MTAKQSAHLDRKWMKVLKKGLQINKRERESAWYVPPDPKRLPA